MPNSNNCEMITINLNDEDSDTDNSHINEQCLRHKSKPNLLNNKINNNHRYRRCKYYFCFRFLYSMKK